MVGTFESFRVPDIVALSFVTQQGRTAYLSLSVPRNVPPKFSKATGVVVLKKGFLAINAVSRPKAKAVP